MAKKDVLRDISCTRWKKMKNRTVFSKKKSGQPKVAIQLCHLEEEGGPCASAGRLTDPSKLHLHNFGYWWLNLSFWRRPRNFWKGTVFPRHKLTSNMGLKTPTCAHGTLGGLLQPTWKAGPDGTLPWAFFTLHGREWWGCPTHQPSQKGRNQGGNAQTTRGIWPRPSTCSNHSRWPWIPRISPNGWMRAETRIKKNRLEEDFLRCCCLCLLVWWLLCSTDKWKIWPIKVHFTKHE